MKRFAPVVVVALGFSLLCASSGLAADTKLPSVGGKKVVALVNDEPIFLEDLSMTLGIFHAEAEEKETKSHSGLSRILDRMINAKLILQEASNIGLDELPEVKNSVDVFQKAALREKLFNHHVRNIRKPDEKAVEKIYRAMVKELKISSVFMRNEEDAKKLEEALKAGGVYVELTKQLVADGKAEGGGEGGYVKPRDLLPAIAKNALNMKAGEVSPVVKVGKGYALFRVEDIRYPDDAEAKETARKEAVKQKKLAALERYKDVVFKKYVKVKKKVYEGLDYESKAPGFESLSRDKRVVAEVKGDNPVTVAELTAGIGEKFFHGIDRAIEEKKINKVKESVFTSIVMKKAFFREAKRLKLDKSKDFRYRLQEYRQAVVFGTFIQRVVDPEIRIDEKELKAYYADHAKEFTSTEMIKVSSLIFSKREDAEDTIVKLRSGADFRWVKVNVSGQVDKKTAEKQGQEKGNLVPITGLPAAMQTEVEGSAPGDYRFYADPDGYFHVLYIEEVVPASTPEFEQVRETVRKKIFEEKRERSMEDWTKKLLAVAEVKKLAQENELKELLMKH